MKKLLQGAVLPFVIFASGILLLGCNQPVQQSQQYSSSDTEHTADSEQKTAKQEHAADSSESTSKSRDDFKQGNMFYIARDVANVQLNTGNYVDKPIDRIYRRTHPKGVGPERRDKQDA